jgi:tetratricopeptide (TPR) repeat protein
MSKSLRRARQMMAQGSYDKACYWYDEATAEHVRTNALVNERLTAYGAACNFHITAARKKLSAADITGAVTEAKTAERCAVEVPEFADRVKEVLGECADAYAGRAAGKPLKMEDDFRQAISDLEKAIGLLPDAAKKQQYADRLDRVKARFADWLKDRGRLSEAAHLLAGVRRKPPTGSGTASPDDSTKTLERIEAEIQRRRQRARRELAKAQELLQEGKWEEALSSFKQVRELDRTLERRVRYGEKGALAGQAREKAQAAIEKRNWDEAHKWLKQWQENAGGKEAADAAKFIEGGRKSDKLLAQANVQIQRALLNAAEDLLQQAISFAAFDLKGAGAVDTAIRRLKTDAVKAADSAKELALQARFSRAKSEVERGKSIWSDWDRWSTVEKFVNDEEARAEFLAAAEEAFRNGEYQEARDNFRKALRLRYDEEITDKVKASEDWITSNELLAKAGAELRNKNLKEAITLASKAVDLQPENEKARSLLGKVKATRAEVNRVFTRAQEFCQRRDWREGITLLEQCVSMDSSHAKAVDTLQQAKKNLQDEWGIRYNPDAMPAHVLLRHWLAWLGILSIMAAMIALRKNAYVRFASSGIRQLALREHLLGRKWWRHVRNAASAVLLAVVVTTAVAWIGYEYRVAELREKASQLESSGEVLKARQTHQSIVELHPLSHFLPSSRLAIMNFSDKLPDEERVPLQYQQTELQNRFEGSRRAVSPYSIDYGPLLVSLASLGILAFLLSFRLKKRLVPRFLLCAFAIPPAMVLLTELLSTHSVGIGTIALPVSAFSRFIPYLAADVSIGIAVVLCFVGSQSLTVSTLFLSKRREDRLDAKRERGKPLVVGRTRKALLKEKLPWLPTPKPQAKTTEKKPAAAGELPRDSVPAEPQAGEKEKPVSDAGAGKPESGDVMAADDYIKLLGDPRPEWRIEAARALGECGEARGLESLIEALSDSDEKVCEAAAQALEKVGKSDLDLLKIAIKKEKNEMKKAKLNEIVTKITSSKH